MNTEPQSISKSVFRVILLIGAMWGFLFTEIGALWLWRRIADRAEARRKSQPAEEKEVKFESRISTGADREVNERNGAARARLADLRRKWTARLDQVKPPAVTRPDLLVAVAEMRERLTASADRRGVGIAPDAGTFGFGLIAQQPPPVEERPAVARQLHAVELLVNVLFEVQPRVLLGVQREPPSGASPEGKVRPKSTLPQGAHSRAETLTLDPSRRMGSLDQFKTTALRFSFCGGTETLRHFVNEIVSREWPAVIREIEVTPLTAAENALVAPVLRDARAPASANPGRLLSGTLNNSESQETASVHPVLHRQWSRFAVTIEWIEGLPAMPEADA